MFDMSRAEKPWSNIPRSPTYNPQDRKPSGSNGVRKKYQDSDADISALRELIRSAGAEGIKPAAAAKMLPGKLTEHRVRRMANRMEYPMYFEDDGRMCWDNET